VLVLFSFLMQGYVAQAHLHFPASTTGAPALHMPGDSAEAATESLSEPPLPSRDHPVNCSLCQALAQAGAMLASANAWLSSEHPRTAIVAIPPSQLTGGIELRHAARPRAPPISDPNQA
jgi:hypothetical protein